MPRNGTDGQSDRFQEAVDVVSALGEPEEHFKNDSRASWGESDDDYYREEQTDVKAATYEEVMEFYDNGYPEDISITKRG